MRKKINFMMIQYKIKKRLIKINYKKIIFGTLMVMITIFACAFSMVLFSTWNDEASTAKMISSATSILVLLELYEAFQKTQ